MLGPLERPEVFWPAAASGWVPSLGDHRSNTCPGGGSTDAHTVRSLTLEMIRRLHRQLGIPADVLLAS